MNFDAEIAELAPLAEQLGKAAGLEEKEAILHTYLSDKCKEFQKWLPHCPDHASRNALLSLFAIGQHKTLFADHPEARLLQKLPALLSKLVAVDYFYEQLGGIVGYHLTVLRLLAQNTQSARQAHFRRAPGIDLSTSSNRVHEAVMEGIRALPGLGEIYPIGGLGSRLNLLSDSGEPLPAASLPFAGRTLLNGLVRDVQAREFLYYRLFGQQVTIPIAMMTSSEKKNDERVRSICEADGWFGRPKESFFLFSQLSVPVVSAEGKWVLNGPLEPLLQPGGHGALWRTAEEKGVFSWFSDQKKRHLLIRQINNPIAGVDHGLTALLGIGRGEKRTFGFASCERLPHAAEGVLVMKEEEGKAHVSNIEYTDFKRFGVEDCPGHPANTNILYADLERLRPVIARTPLPGLMLNMKQSSAGIQEGRLESMMQSISDTLRVEKGEPLPTFVTYNTRRRTISTTKRSLEPGKEMLETPEGAFYDLLHNAHTLLKERCGVNLSAFCDPETYLREGPSHLFLYHPALGPLYSLIAQKIAKGRFAEGSELQAEIADLIMEECDIDGSCLIEAHNLLGHTSEGQIRYSQKTGKCHLKDVRIQNRGIDRAASNTYWKNQIQRHQAFKIVLEGHSEFYAEGLTFNGDQTIVVPDGERWIARRDGSFHREKADWTWSYEMRENVVSLQLGVHSPY